MRGHDTNSHVAKRLTWNIPPGISTKFCPLKKMVIYERGVVLCSMSDKNIYHKLELELQLMSF